MELQVARLAELGEAGAAQLLLDFYGPLLGGFRHARAQFALDLRNGDRASAEAAFRQLLALTTDSERAELVAHELILQPDERFYRELHAHYSRDPVLRRAVDGPTLWAAGLVCGAPVEAAWWQHNGRQPSGEAYPRISAIDFESRNFTAVDSVASVVNVLTFPRETVLVLLTNLPPAARPALPPRPPAPGPAKG